METIKFRRCWYTESLESIAAKGNIHITTDDKNDICLCGKHILSNGRWYLSFMYFLGREFIYDRDVFQKVLNTITCKKCHTKLKLYIDGFEQKQLIK